MATNYVNVLVHGLFFMWLNQQTGSLELIAPAVDTSSTNPHHLLGGVRGHLQEFQGLVDWSNKGLIGSAPPKLQPGEMPSNLQRSVLQFSMKELDLRGWSDKSANFVGRFILPWPIAFYSVRHDYFDRAFVYNPSNTGKAIWGHCRPKDDPNAEIGLVTCLQYEYEEKVSIPYWRGDMNVHCYFEPCQKHDVYEANKDLIKARNSFANPPAFDLQMNERAMQGIITPRGRNSKVPPGLDKNDDYSLFEDPDKPKDICSSSGIGLLNINPANCPNFFVGP